jgi:hypothetical protein
MCALVGCTLTQSHLRTDDLLPGGLGRTGQVIVPKQCALKMMIPARPLGDPALNAAVWNVADAQAIDDAARRALEANGLRVGVITGDLPAEVRGVLEAPPPNRIDPAIVIIPDGDNTLVDLGATKAELTLLLNRDGTIAGKPYKDAKGHIRLTAARAGDAAVTLRIVPELHHGPVRQGWGTAPGGGALAPQQLVPRTGQAEETFRELAATVTLHPGQVAVIGTLPDRQGSLGHFLFTAPEANSDRLTQKLLLVWATGSNSGTDDAPLDLPAGLQPYEPDITDTAPTPE